MINPIVYKQHHICPTLAGWFEVFLNGRFYKSETLKGAMHIVNDFEEGKL